MVLDQLGQASDPKRNGRDTERHRIDDCGAKSLRARRMQEDVEPRHGPVNLVDEPGSERRETSDRLCTGGFPTKKDESNLVACCLGQAFADLGERRDPFFRGHRTHDTADDGVARPAAFEPPVSWPRYRRAWYARVNEVDAVRVDTAGHERVADRAGDGDEAPDTPPVFQAASRNEWHATGDDERQRPSADHGGQRDGVRAGVMRVDQVCVPGPKHRADAARGGEVPVAAHSDRRGRDSGGAESADERSVRRGDDQRFVSHLTLAACEEIHLALPAAPFAAGVEVQQTQRGRGRHLRRMSCPAGSRNASWWLEPQPSGPNVARVVPSHRVSTPPRRVPRRGD